MPRQHNQLTATRSIEGVGVFSCNLPHALLAESLGSFMNYCMSTAVEQILKYELAQKVNSGAGEENSPVAPAGNQSHGFSIMSPSLDR